MHAFIQVYLHACVYTCLYAKMDGWMHGRIDGHEIPEGKTMAGPGPDLVRAF